MKPNLVSAVARRARHLAIACIAVLCLCSLAHAQDICATAPTVNPASAPGLGGTGAYILDFIARSNTGHGGKRTIDIF